mmetsp:Transcript_9801/g.29843  ORF Transcript_9801/g.29843 Transcript_9801/m.29843 type:complete len:590 (+) Transcript_9801:78-1847(+)
MGRWGGERSVWMAAVVMMGAMAVGTAVAQFSEVFTSGRCERGDTALLDPRCFYGAAQQGKPQYPGTLYDEDLDMSFLSVEIAEQYPEPLLWGLRTNDKKQLDRADEVLRRVVESFSAISLRRFEIDTEDIQVKVTEVIDRRGMVGVIARYEKAGEDVCFEAVKSQDRIGSFGMLECNANNRLVTQSSVGRKGVWAAVAASGSIFSPVAASVPSPLYRVKGGVPRKPRKPTFIRTNRDYRAPQLYPANYLGLQTCDGTSDCEYERLELDVTGSKEIISHRYRRSTDARDLAYVTRLVNKAKKPWDAVEVEFMTVRYDIGTVQLIIGTDKNGYLGLIINIAGRNLKTAQLLYFERRHSCEIYRFAANARLGVDAARDSNVGRPGQHVFTMSQTGLLSGPRVRNINAYNICYKSSTKKDTVDGVPDILYAKYGNPDCQPGPKHVGYGLGDEEMWAWQTCALTGKRALETPLGDVRKAGAKDFKPSVGILVRAPVTTNQGKTFIAEIVYLFEKDGRSAGVINMPPWYKEQMHVGFYDFTSGDVEVEQRWNFTSSASNVGVAGRNVFVLQEVQRKPDPKESFTVTYPNFEIVPS